jgi:uncharacterized FAD-dependent dehydrogenase
MSAPRYRLVGLSLPVDAPQTALLEAFERRTGLGMAEVESLQMVKRSLDARREGGAPKLSFVYQLEFGLRSDSSARRSPALGRLEKSGALLPARVLPKLRVERAAEELRVGRTPIAVLGAGPAGLFAAWMLAAQDLPVVVIDRGSNIERRGRELVRFHRTRIPDPESNLLFGEGGAGSYSDGKLYTRVDDEWELPIVRELVACGAPAEILYDSRAHIGTDKLHRVLPALRARLIERGVEFRWNTRVDGLKVRERKGVRSVTALATSAGDLECRALVLAPGHSARSTFAMLLAAGVALESKPFQLGMRIEHPQELIDRAQLGLGAAAESVGAAYYALVSKHSEQANAAFSFCMCPGGRIVASVNEPGYLCTNGMSNSRHSSRWANAALVTTIPASADPLGGVEQQRALEQRFFEAGGADYTAPAQRASDFLARRESRGALNSSYGFGTVSARLDALLEPQLVAALEQALLRFERTIPGFAGDQGLFVGLESRSSGPVRMPRGREDYRAAGFDNLFPVGEGAGWAGGIMSAAIDGVRAARALVERGLVAAR